MSAHNYILQSAVHGNPHHWVIFCTKCGYVAWHGNSPEKSLSQPIPMPEEPE